MSGGTKGAADGTLTIMVGGEDEALVKARPVLEGFFFLLVCVRIFFGLTVIFFFSQAMSAL